MSWRSAVLEAVGEALRLHQHLENEQQTRIVGGGVDVFGAILRQSVPLVFRPLDHLLGAYVPKPSAGIMITTERSLPIQRFTAAHELGHLVLGHSGSLDDASILDRSPFSGPHYDAAEAAADAFASSFLIPEWLLEIHAERQGWNADSFTHQHTVYQLSLRIGASYKATCHALRRYNVITQQEFAALNRVAPKTIKRALLGTYQLSDWHPDVWVLTERDEGLLIQGGPKDIFRICLKEHSGSGYLWNIDELQKAGFALVRNELIIPNESEEIGGPADRILLASSQSEIAGKLDLKQVRPWEHSSVDAIHFTVSYDLFGKENGLPRSQREGMAAA
jgi:predicted secreted protein